MASISPTSLSNYAEPFTDKGGYIKLTITGITQTDGGTNQTTVSWKLTVEGTPWVNLSAYYATLGGKVIVPRWTGTKGSWHAGDILASGSTTFDNASDGSLTLYAYVKQIFYYTFSEARWSNSSIYQENGVNMVCSQIPRYFSSKPTITLTSKTETTATFSWTTSEKCSTVQYKIDNGSWVDVVSDANATSGSYTITGLSPNTSYRIYGDYKRRDSGLWAQDKPYTDIKTYNYPYVKSVNKNPLDIGSQQTAVIYNPLGRTGLAFYMKKTNTSGTTLFSNTNLSPGTGENVSYNFTPTASTLYASIPNNVDATAVYYCTYSSQTVQTVSGKYQVLGTEGPTFGDNKLTNFKDTLHASDITGNNSKFISGHNALQGTIVPMTFNNSATSTNARYVVAATGNPTSQELTYSSSNKNFTVSNLTANLITVTAYDSRGLPTAATKQIDLVPYSNPSVDSFVVNRQGGVGTYATIDASGTYTYFNWSGVVNHNSIKKVYYRQKLSTSSTWGSWIDITSSVSSSNGNWTLTKTLDTVFTNTAKYDFEIYVQDVLNENSEHKTTQLSTANALLWRDLQNKRLGINKKPDEALDVAGNAKVSGNATIGGTINGHTLGNVCELTYTVVDTW